MINNVNKVCEFSVMLVLYDIIIKMLVDFLNIFEIKENGIMFEENVIKKVMVVVEVIGLLVIVDDFGLMVKVLYGDLGVFLVWYVGDYDDVVNNVKLLVNFGGVFEVEWIVIFYMILVVFKFSGEKFVVNGELVGCILIVFCGDNGFGYDLLFWLSKF